MPMTQALTSEQQLKYLNNEQRFWLREARKHDRIAKRYGKAGLSTDAGEALARARQAYGLAKQYNPSITRLRRELRLKRQQSVKKSPVSRARQIDSASGPVTTHSPFSE